DAIEVLPNTLHTGCTPIQITIRWTIGNHKKTRRIHPIFILNLLGGDHILFRLGHLFTTPHNDFAAITDAFLIEGHLIRVKPFSGLTAISFVTYHSLGEKGFKWFLDR